MRPLYRAGQRDSCTVRSQPVVILYRKVKILNVYAYDYHWLGAYRTNALYSGHIFVRFNVLRMYRGCVYVNCVVFLLFGFKPLGKGVLLIYVFIMAIFGDG